MPLPFRRKNKIKTTCSSTTADNNNNQRRRSKRRNHGNTMDVEIATSNSTTESANDCEEEMELKATNNGLDEMTVATSSTVEMTTTTTMITPYNENENENSNDDESTSYPVRSTNNINIHDDYDLGYSFHTWSKYRQTNKHHYADLSCSIKLTSHFIFLLSRFPAKTNKESNMNQLVSSPVFQNAILSTILLTSTITKSILHHTIQHPIIIKPIQYTFSKVYSSLTLVQYSTIKLVNQLAGGVKSIVNGSGCKQQHLLITNHNENDNNNDKNIHARQRDDFDDDTYAGTTTPTRTHDNTNVKNIDDLLKDLAFETVPVIYNTTQGLISSTLSFIFGGDSGDGDQDNVSNTQIYKDDYDDDYNDDIKRIRIMSEIVENDDHEYMPISTNGLKDEKMNESEQHGIIDSSTTLIATSFPPSNITSTTSETNADDSHSSLSSNPSFIIRVCDLNLYSNSSHLQISTINNKKIDTEEKKEENPTIHKLLVLELKLAISSINTIVQMNMIQMVDKMVDIGLKIALQCDDNCDSSISWKEEGSTAKILKRIDSCSNYTQILESDVLLWSGSKDERKESAMNGLTYAKVPFFKGHGVINTMGAREMTELLLDSSKVTLYNKWSNGRVDSVIYESDIDMVDGLFGTGCTKIVESETNVPFSSNKIKVANLLHARPIVLDDENGRMNGECSNHVSDRDDDDKNHLNNNVGKAYIIVSRSLQKCEISDNTSHHHDSSNNGPKNEIIWGVNILRDIPCYPGKTDVIIVSQASTPALPSFLIQKVSS